MRLSKASVTELYARYGITAHWAELLPSGVVYDDYHVALGGDIPTVGRITNFHYAMTLHDLAHFFVATPRARRMPNFGLGQAPHVTKRCCYTPSIKRRRAIVSSSASQTYTYDSSLCCPPPSSDRSLRSWPTPRYRSSLPTSCRAVAACGTSMLPWTMAHRRHARSGS